jgi:hypothetical protein
MPHAVPGDARQRAGPHRLPTLALLLCVACTCPALAQTPDDGDTENDEAEIGAAREQHIEFSCRDPQDRPPSWLDRTHSYLTQRLCEPAAWFDGFFGDPRALEETPVGTFFRLRTEARWDETDDYRVRVRLNANISLPRLSERVRLLVTRDEDVRGEFEDDPRLEGSRTDTRVGLRYILSDKQRARFDVDGTVKVGLQSFNPILRGRYRQTEPLTDRTLGRFSQIAFWEREDGFGTTSRVDWEWLPDHDSLLRWTAEGTYSEATDGIHWRTAVVGFHQLNTRTALRSEIGVFGRTQPDFEADEFFVNFRFRRSFLRPWLFYELQPERGWPRDRVTGDRRSDWRFTITLEAQFENLAAREERLERRARSNRPGER